MQLIAYIDIRFGDPVSALYMTNTSLAYGTMLGRIVYYNFVNKTETLINEFSEECIRGIFLEHYEYDECLYCTIGDLKCLVIENPSS